METKVRIEIISDANSYHHFELQKRSDRKMDTQHNLGPVTGEEKVENSNGSFSRKNAVSLQKT